MMTQLKFALTFILGMVYMYMWEFVVTFTGNTDTDTTYNVFVMLLIAETMLIISGVIFFFIYHWREE